MQAMLTRLQGLLSPIGVGTFLQSFVAPHLKESARDTFDTEGDDLGEGGWAPLKESTLRIRESKGFPSGPINHRTGALRRYVTSNNGSISTTGFTTNLRWPSDPPIQGSDLMFSYATAQAGSAHWGTPARPVVSFTFQDAVAINLALGKWLESVPL